MKRGVVAVLACLTVTSLGAARLDATHDAAAQARTGPSTISLDSLRPASRSKATSLNNYSSVTFVAYTARTAYTYNGKRIDRGIMFGLLPGHGGASSEADITFRLGKKYDRLSGVVFANGGAGPTSPLVEVQDTSDRGKAPRELFMGQAGQSGHIAFMVGVRGVDVLKITASAAFDCVCDSGSTALVAGTLTAAPAQQRH